MFADQRIERAVEFIASEAGRIGDLIGHCKGLEYQAKVIKGQAYLDATGTIQARDAQAVTTPEYKAIIEEIENAWAEKETLQAQFKAAELMVEVWRSQQATNRRGNI
jgi:uncharacterized protein (UPF0335 family)